MTYFVITWAWAEIVKDRPHPCHERYQIEGKPQTLRCSFAEKRIRDLIEDAHKQGIHQSKIPIPTKWACLPYAAARIKNELKKSIIMGIDPLHQLTKRRTFKDKLKKKTKQELILQTQNALPLSRDAFVHLEAQGYLCFHYQFDHHVIRYWYEHPRRGFIAILEWDSLKDEVIEICVARDGKDVFYRLLKHEGMEIDKEV